MKMRIKILVILLSIISFNCNSQTIEFIKIYFVDLNLETPFRIQCERFNQFFHSEIDSVCINNSHLIKNIMLELNNLPIASDSVYSLPDTRIKIKIIYSNRVSDIICLDKFTVYKNGKLFILSKKLIDLIKNKIRYMSP